MPVQELVPQTVIEQLRTKLASISGIVEVSTACNLRCTYCFATRPNPKIMDRSVVERIIDSLARFNGPGQETKYIWHGGEPLLAGLPFFRHVLDVQARLADIGYVSRNSIQSNGTLLTDEWVDFLRDNHFGVGSSLDGLKEIHDTKRIGQDGKGSYDLVMANIQRARERGLTVGVICVIERDTLPHVERIYREMKGSGIHFTMSPVTPTRSGVHSSAAIQPLTPDEYADVLIRLFDIWFDDPEQIITVNPPHSVVQGLLYGGLPLFCNSDDSCFSRFVSFLPDGSVYPCNRFASESGFRLGNVLLNDLSTILEQEPRKSLLARTKATLEPCSVCESNDMCRGGCAHHAYAFHGDVFKPDYYCQAFLRAFRYYHDRVVNSLYAASSTTTNTSNQKKGHS